jgi:tryptophan-rich sensory protein
LALVGFVGLCTLVGLVELLFTVPALPGWYRSLAAPPGTPPARLVLEVWALLYLMLGVSAWLIWRQAGLSRPPHYRALRLWGWQLMAHTAWTLVFFGMHALLVGGLLVGLIAWLAAETWRRFAAIDRRAAWLMTPYVAWIGYALWLSAGFWWLNKPG